MALRLQGLARGQHIANKQHKRQAQYSYEVLYLTAVYCRDKITRYLHQNEKRINDEGHRINLIMRFLEADVNNVFLKVQAGRVASQKAQAANLDAQQNKGAAYQPKGNTSRRLKDIW